MRQKKVVEPELEVLNRKMTKEETAEYKLVAQTEDAGRQSDRQVGRRQFGLAASARRQQAGGEATGKQ